MNGAEEYVIASLATNPAHLSFILGSQQFLLTTHILENNLKKKQVFRDDLRKEFYIEYDKDPALSDAKVNYCEYYDYDPATSLLFHA
tara:strand:- start:224 stop:484 length:261 start_codon:yes stop_codon:yes gene_type:complete